jgi:hypothetical protein
MTVEEMAEGDRVIGVRVGHGWDAEISTALVLLQLRNDAFAMTFASASRSDGRRRIDIENLLSSDPRRS